MWLRILRVSLLVGAIVASAAEAQTPTVAQPDDLAALRGEIERLKSTMPGQSVAMTQAAYNFSNLWFAAHAENWPLAQSFFRDTRGRLRWALRITSVLNTSSGELKLTPFLDSLEKNQLAKLEEAIVAKKITQFEAAYRATLDACSACHAASEKPYFSLQVPTAPAEPLMRFTVP